MVGLRAVVFDLGGVVLGSPLHAIAEYERACGVSAGLVNRVVASTAPAGAWSRLERGEIALEGFYDAFEAECRAAGQHIDAREMMLRMAAAAEPRPRMLAALSSLRARGLKTAALTNNWDTGAELDEHADLRPLFDVFVESRVVGLRKPDPRIYQLACRELEIGPAEAVFLDDIGRNLKAARALGMTTLKVEDPATALAELGRILGFPEGTL